MATELLTRRRALGLLAAAAGLPLVARASRATAEVVTWHGRALGAPATLILHHPHRPAAERLLAACAAELERLEAILSLYRPTSALSELNRAGALAAPPPELVAILDDCRGFHAATATLVDMGEIRAAGDRAWRVGIAGSDTVLALTDRAVATSAPLGFAFDPGRRFTHIIDPRTGATPRRYARVTVTAPTAAEADALSTGFALMTDVPPLPGVTADLAPLPAPA